MEDKKLYNAVRKIITLADGRQIEIETGKLAKQADGSVVVKQGDTMLLATVVAAKDAKPDTDFMPLQVEYKEKYASCGRYPGGFMKREGRANDSEILVARLIDRALRPLFPADYHAEVYVTVNLISADKDIQPDALAGLAASAALAVSDIPFGGPISEVRVARLDGEYVINPKFSEMDRVDLDIMVGGTIDNILMVEGEMKEVSEEVMLGAIKFAHEEIKKHCAVQIELSKELGKDVKRTYCHEENDEELRQLDRQGALRQGLRHRHQRYDEARARGYVQRPRSRIRRALFGGGAGRESHADPQILPRRRAEEGHAQHDPRRGPASRRPQDRRDPSDLVRGGLPARRPRFGDLHPRRNAVADQRYARHETRRKAEGRSAGAGHRAVRAPL